VQSIQYVVICVPLLIALSAAPVGPRAPRVASPGATHRLVRRGRVHDDDGPITCTRSLNAHTPRTHRSSTRARASRGALKLIGQSPYPRGTRVES